MGFFFPTGLFLPFYSHIFPIRTMGNARGRDLDMPKLSAAKVKSTTKPGMHSDGGTLYLCIAPGGSKSWIQRIAIAGRRHDIGLGSTSLVTLAEARDIAHDNRKLARAGGNPLAQKRRAAVPNFAEATERFLKAKGDFATAKGWRESLQTHAFPTLGALPVDKIDGATVLKALTPIWTTKAPTARKVRQRIRAVLGWAQAHGFIEHNSAGDSISGALPKARAAAVHHRALPYREVAGALEIIDRSGSSLAARLALKLVVLTASRG